MRIVCNFSAGAASAVATKLILAEHVEGVEVCIVNAFIVEEHPDNLRFARDCEAWFGQAIIPLRDSKYGASIMEVFKRKRYMAGKAGAPCSKALKRDILDAFRRDDDVLVLGYTAEEDDRYEKFCDANPHIKVRVPLIEKGLSKADCLSIIERAGIKLPAMYLLGYDNNNCVGCIKGGMGYWNKIRRDFPAVFEERAALQELLGPGAYFFRNRKTGERISLRTLPRDAGRYQNEPTISCSVFCEATSNQLRQVQVCTGCGSLYGGTEKGDVDYKGFCSRRCFEPLEW